MNARHDSFAVECKFSSEINSEHLSNKYIAKARWWEIVPKQRSCNICAEQNQIPYITTDAACIICHISSLIWTHCLDKRYVASKLASEWGKTKPEPRIFKIESDSSDSEASLFCCFDNGFSGEARQADLKFLPLPCWFLTWHRRINLESIKKSRGSH